jgi:hypothetical protein
VREIREMSWLVDDIRSNGLVTTPDDAAAVPVPSFDSN